MRKAILITGLVMWLMIFVTTFGYFATLLAPQVSNFIIDNWEYIPSILTALCATIFIAVATAFTIWGAFAE